MTQTETIVWHPGLEGFDFSNEEWVLLQDEGGDVWQSYMLFFDDLPENKEPVFMRLGEEQLRKKDIIAWSELPKGVHK